MNSLGTTESPASRFATEFLAECSRRGLRDVVVCPGSRSQALALAAAQLEELALIRLHVRIDERSAAFLALGIAIESGSPVAVVTTSGTAAANLAPAMLEAAHSGVPLLAITADRPAELHGIRANQTTRQEGMLTAPGTARWQILEPGTDEDARRLAREVMAHTAGPGHLNIAFREPLSGPVSPLTIVTHDADDADAGESGHLDASLDPPIDVPLSLEPAPRTVVVAGARAGADAELLARELGAPLLAEVSSGARFGPNLVPAYRELLAEPGFGDRVERAIVLGHPTLSREVPALVEREDVETIVVRSPGLDDYNPGHRVGRFVDAIRATHPADPALARPWVGRWVAASRQLLAVDDDLHVPPDDLAARAAYARAQLDRLRARVTRRQLVEAVWAASWPHDRLVLASSRLIREADRVVPGKRIRVSANRGLAGIDGNTATAWGVALASQRDAVGPGVTRLLSGDLAALHDIGSLLAPPGEQRPRLQLIVGNDRGGTIFDGLEVAQTTDAGRFDRVMLTPHEVDFGSLAAAYGWEHRLVANRGELDQALTSPGELVLIEVPLER